MSLTLMPGGKDCWRSRSGGRAVGLAPLQRQVVVKILMVAAAGVRICTSPEALGIMNEVEDAK